MDPDPKETESEWSALLRLCESKTHIGFGELDSFLSGPDLARRIALVETEAGSNEWLRLELRDTLALEQSQDWSEEQRERLRRIALGE